MKFEHRTQPVIPRARFVLRLLRSAGLAAIIVFAALGIGIFGYRHFEGMSWIDALLNAAMILSGMGPMNELHTDGGKLFASAYAIFSGVVFLTVTALVFGPILHRLIHHFHLDR